MSNSLVRFFTGEPEPRKEARTDVELAQQYHQRMQMTSYQMEMDQALTRAAIQSVVNVNRLCNEVAGDDPDLKSLVRPIQDAYSRRIARKLEGS
ncbi:hypothetical protein [Paeniglutamicibacter sp. NPDC091659]|uniref:hypothetical protein n=1 Tax=Paeniglutamicibacter sp. NPDC091659 TaxID=3364389 RepID=UPI0037FBFF65